MPAATASEGLRKVTGASRKSQIPRIRGVDPAQDLDHGAFARAILTEQGVDLARLAGKVCLAQRTRTPPNRFSMVVALRRGIARRTPLLGRGVVWQERQHAAAPDLASGSRG